MKLIDLLVKELPKRGGWPDGAVECCRHYGTNSIDFYDETGNWDNDCYLKYGKDFAKDCIYEETSGSDRLQSISRSEYESALAASQKSVWSGEGIPPVGCECEVSVDGGRSWCTYRAINEKNGVRLIEIGNLTEEFQNNNWIFRPLRTEAERKREAAAKEMARHANDDAHRKFNAGLRNCLSIYDAIAAGKIPGVKLED